MASGKESVLNENDRLNFTGTFIDANRDKMLGRNSEAINGFAHCIKIDPTCATCYYEIAGIMQAQRQIKLAVPYAKKQWRWMARTNGFWPCMPNSRMQ